MPKAHKRKTPITVDVPHGKGISSSSPRSSRTVIRRFHTLIKRRAQLEKKKADEDNTKELDEVERETNELGGLEAYQRMSTIGQGSDRGGGSEKVLIAWLKEDDIHGEWCRQKGKEGEKEKLRLLEVGALKPDNYRSCASFLDVTPIDLNSRHSAIMEQDFLLMDEDDNREVWDILSLSLVANFVPNAADRGRMLRLAHSMLKPGGFLFLALPLPCVLNSRYMTFEHLKALMAAIGFEQIREKWREGGKMAYWLYRKVRPDLREVDRFRKKETLRSGNRNNFVILA